MLLLLLRCQRILADRRLASVSFAGETKPKRPVAKLQRPDS